MGQHAGTVGQHGRNLQWDSGMSDFSIDNLANVDCILHGRKTAEGFIPYWNDVANDPDHSEYKLGRRFSQISNAVFSNTLRESKWNNTTIINGELPTAIEELKIQNGSEILVYGGESFVASLLKHDLIDEVYLFLNPAAIGNGVQTFNPLKHNSAFKLVECRPFPCGAVLVHYSK